MLSCAAAAAALLHRRLSAQEKAPIRLVVGVTAGGSIDLIARLLADKLKDSLGDQVVVENRAGAGGRLAVNEVKNSRPDGRTIYVNTSGPFSVLPNVYGDRLDYDPIKDFTPIGRLVRFDLAFTTGPAVPRRTSRSASPGRAQIRPKRAYGTPGPGTTSHFIGVMIAQGDRHSVHACAVQGRHAGDQRSDRRPRPVPRQFVRRHDRAAQAGKLRILADTGPNRSPLAPEIPTLKESGIDVAADVAIDAYGPGEPSADMVKRLHAALTDAIQAPTYSSV